MSKEPDWRALAREMSEISEQAFCAGWMEGLEHFLWEIVNGGPRKYGRIVVSDPQIARLRALSDRVRGWVWFNGEAEEELVDLERWQRLHAQWVRAQRSR